MMASRVFQYLVLKWQILLVKIKHMNCVQNCHSQLQQNYEMTKKKFHLTVPCNRTVCFYFNTQFPVGTLRVMLFQKLHTTALANDNSSQETGKQSLQDVFFLSVNITQKKSIPDLQEESVELRNPKCSL